jgi:PAS domain S-box-containing protein
MNTDRQIARGSGSVSGLHAVTALLTGGAFLLDLLTSLGLAAWLLYCLPLLVVSRARKPPVPLVFAAAATALIVIGFFYLEPDPAAPERRLDVANRFLAVGVLWVTAIVLAQRRQAYETLRQSREVLEERTRELSGLTEALQEEIGQRREAEEAARWEQAFRETVEDSLVAGLVAVDTEGKILSVNDAFCAMTGWSKEELLGTGPAYPFWAPEEIRTMYMVTRKTLGAGVPLAGQELILRRRGGERFPALVYASPLRDPDGTLKGYVGSVTDVTERKRAEMALKESEERFRGIVEDQTELICRWRPDTTLTFVNEAYCRFFGTAKEELLGTSFLLLIPEEDRESVRDFIARVLPSLTPADPAVTYEHPVTGTAGEVRWQQWTDRAIFDGDGRLLELQSVGWDVTERKRAEMALKESEERFRTLVEHSLVGFFLVQEGQVVFQNPEQGKLFGTPPEDFPLESLGSRIHIKDLSRFAALLLAVHGGDRRGHETDFRFLPFGPADSSAGPGDAGLSGRSYRWVHCRTSPTLYRGKKAALVNMIDITRFKELERMALIQEKMAALGQVAAGIAHEIRNPLSGLNLYLSAAERMVADAGEVSEETREDLRTVFSQMKAASGKVERIVRRVMEFARPEPLRLELVDVCEAVHEAVQLAAATVRKRGVVLEETRCGNLPRCRADARLLEQVLINLITNAVQAMERQAGAKRIAVGCAAEDGYIRITVADSGPGVPIHLREKVFEPFFTTKKEGTGIGLSLSRKIVSDHGGFLTVGTSALGGALFTVGVPIGAADTMADI